MTLEELKALPINTNVRFAGPGDPKGSGILGNITFVAEHYLCVTWMEPALPNTTFDYEMPGTFKNLHPGKICTNLKKGSDPT